MNMKKKRKKVKKYAVGGDLRGQQPNAMMVPPFNLGGGGDDGSATGQVRAISKAAGRAGDYLSTAGKAIGSGGQGGGYGGPPPGPTIDTFPPPTTGGPLIPPAPPPFGDEDDMKTGGSVKKKPVKKNMGGMMKYKKGGKVKVRGAGKAIKGVRPAKMIKMKGS